VTIPPPPSHPLIGYSELGRPSGFTAASDSLRFSLFFCPTSTSTCTAASVVVCRELECPASFRVFRGDKTGTAVLSSNCHKYLLPNASCVWLCSHRRRHVTEEAARKASHLRRHSGPHGYVSRAVEFELRIFGGATTNRQSLIAKQLLANRSQT
jgi:hypothetical protein